MKGLVKLIRDCKLRGPRSGSVMKPRQVSPVFRATFPSDNYWTPGGGYLETEKLGTTLDTLTKLGQVLEFRGCKGMRTLEKY